MDLPMDFPALISTAGFACIFWGCAWACMYLISGAFQRCMIVDMADGVCSCGEGGKVGGSSPP